MGDAYSHTLKDKIIYECLLNIQLGENYFYHYPTIDNARKMISLWEEYKRCSDGAHLSVDKALADENIEYYQTWIYQAFED